MEMSRAIILILALLPIPAHASDLGLDYAAVRQPEVQEICEQESITDQVKSFWCGAAFELSMVLGLSGYCLDEDKREWRKGMHPSGDLTCSPY